MKPIDKQFGFWLLLISGTYLSIAGHQDGPLFLVAALFYEAIKNDPNP